jgi:N-acetyl-anhydromuramyl-L-alanine amidase AmpD
MTRPAQTLDLARIDRVIVHHSASPLRSTTSESVRGWHRDRGYSDVGYHFLIEANGAVALGRPLWVVGSHDQGENSTSLGVCVLGDWRPTKDGKRPGPEQWAALVRLCADLLDQLDLPTTALFGHRENEPATTPTECPGFDPAELRAAVSAERARRRALPRLYPYTTRT